MTASAIVTLLAGGGDLPPPTHDPDDVHRLAEEILGRREYAPPSKSLLDRAVEAIRDAFDWLFGHGLGVGGPGGSTIGTLLVLAGAAALAVVLIRNWRRPGGRTRPTGGVVVEGEAERSAAEWDTAARRAEEAGDWKAGLRCRFSALVVRLVSAGALPRVPGRTSGEFRADLGESLPAAGPDFAEAARLFERAWYGDLPTGPEEAEAFADRARRVLAASGERR